MIPLSNCKYYIEGVSENFFWRELNKITAGGIDPELIDYARTREKMKKVFVGRRIDNKFSISLNKQMTQFIRAAVVAKGAVMQNGSGLKIHCSFRYPAFSLFIVLASACYVFVRFLPISSQYDLLFGLIVTGLYGVLIYKNHLKTKTELVRQLEFIEQKAMIESTKIKFPWMEISTILGD